jgi:hypothetical protein
LLNGFAEVLAEPVIHARLVYRCGRLVPATFDLSVNDEPKKVGVESKCIVERLQ